MTPLIPIFIVCLFLIIDFLEKQKPKKKDKPKKEQVFSIKLTKEEK